MPWLGDLYSSSGWSFSWRRSIKGGVESQQLNILLALLSNIQLHSIPDKWEWDLDPSGLFSVRSTRRRIDDERLPSGLRPTRWNHFLSKKINILFWRVLLDRIPVKVRFGGKGS